MRSTVYAKGKTVKEFLLQELADSSTVIHDISVRGNVAYVLETRNGTDKTRLNTVSVVVVSKEKDYYTYKTISEFEGPLYYECPVSFLKRLTPLEELKSDNAQYAAVWRAKCFEQHVRRRQIKELKANDFLYVAENSSPELHRKVFQVQSFTHGKTVLLIKSMEMVNKPAVYYRTSALKYGRFDCFDTFEEALAAKESALARLHPLSQNQASA
jgi:hypothetical protein